MTTKESRKPRKEAQIFLMLIGILLVTGVILIITNRTNAKQPEQQTTEEQPETEKKEIPVVELDLENVVIKPQPLGKDVYPEANYWTLSDYACLCFDRDENFYQAKATKTTVSGEEEEYVFYIDDECTQPLGFNPVLLSSQIQYLRWPSGDDIAEAYAVLVEGERVLYFPVGQDLPHIVPIL